MPVAKQGPVAAVIGRAGWWRDDAVGQAGRLVAVLAWVTACWLWTRLRSWADPITVALPDRHVCVVTAIVKTGIIAEVDLSNQPCDEVEAVLTELRERRPWIKVERLKVTHPADDDNLWLISGTEENTVQIESGPDHSTPFLIEAGRPEQSREVPTVDAAVALILE